MSGLIFLVMVQMIEENFGLEVWQKILDTKKILSEGIYTRAETYSIREFYVILVYLSLEVKMDKKDLLRMFGEYLADYIIENYPVFFEGKNLKSSLLNLNNVLTKDLKQIYSDLYLPKMSIEEIEMKKVLFKFKCNAGRENVLEGFIRGVSRYFSESCTIKKEVEKNKNDIFWKMEVQLNV